MINNLTITEIEVGPHFVTLYSRQLPQILELGRLLYQEIRDDLRDIQQVDLEHEPNDPNVYHPFGAPNNFRDEFRHIHIRFGRAITDEDVHYVAQMIDNHVKPGIIKFSMLEDNKDEEFTELIYPPVPEDPDMYLDYIEELRTGKWIKGKQYE